MLYTKPLQVSKGGICWPLLAIGALIGLSLLPQFEQAWTVFPRGGEPVLNVSAYQAPSTPNFIAFTPTFLRSLTPYAVAALVLIILTLRLGRRLSKIAARGARGPCAELSAGAESGSSVIEFALLLPFLLTLLLLILQIALIVQAKFIVNYAAFCAARSAIVTIPAKIYSTRTRRYEINNKIHLNHPASPKMRIIRRAAALPCTAISPVLDPNTLLATGTSPLQPRFLRPLLQVALFPSSVSGVGQELLSRASYAYDEKNTRVEVIREHATSRDFQDHELITVRVTYRYYLAIPGANRLIGKAYNPGVISFLTGTAYYAEMAEQYTLPLEGEPLFPGDPQSWPDGVEQEVYE